MLKNKKNFWKRFDFILFFTVILLNIYGLVMIYSATGDNAMQYIKVQSIALFLGFVAIAFFTFVSYDIFGKFYIPIYVLCNILLLAVLIFGTGEVETGARSWLSVPGLGTFQPSEPIKIGIIICVAKLIDNNKETINKFPTLLKILLFAGLPIALIMKQPDYGTAFVFMFFLIIMLFAAGLNIKYYIYAASAALIAAPIAWMKLRPFQKKRILDFLNPSRDPLGSGYQVTQSKIAIGSGKGLGRGLFNGVQAQFGYIPENHTDFIFAVIGEELGLIGGLALIVLYFIMVYRLIKIAREAKDLFGSLIVIGICAMMVFHIWENIGMTMGLMPVTGIPLPFISYGGSFLLLNMACIGLALSVGMRKDGLNF